MTTGLMAAIDPQVDETWRGKVFFTLDVDWAPDEILDFSLALFRDRRLKCTVFATHETASLDRIKNDDNFEIGLHPNFNGLLFPQAAPAMQAPNFDGLRAIFPGATSIRSHSLVQSSRLQNEFVARGLTHESNTYIPHEAGLELRPWILWNGLIKVPFLFADDLHLYSGPVDRRFDGVRHAGLCVVTFHPIHLYLNTDSIGAYERYKQGAQAGAPIEQFVNRRRFGISDVFNAMVDTL
jgi:hypothetical protein